MNIIDAIDAGIAGRNLGLSFGMPKFDAALGGMQKKESFVWAAEPKVGKTGYVDKLCVINPYLYNQTSNKKWIYYSFEIDRVSKEAKYISHFMYTDFQIDISDKYVLGKERDSEGGIIKVTPEHREKMVNIYTRRIIPLFGEYVKSGNGYTKVKNGLIEFIEQRENPTGIRNHLIAYAQQNGNFIKEQFQVVENQQLVTKERNIGYEPNDPSLHTIVVIDHIRGMARERGFNMKENIDKMSEYHVDIRNLCSFTFHLVVHLHRGLSDIDRIKFMKDNLFPEISDIKDSGNLAEDVTHVITLFNPADDKYNLTTHFGKKFREYGKGYRTMHLASSRYAECPQHWGTLFDGKNIRIKEI